MEFLRAFRSRHFVGKPPWWRREMSAVFSGYRRNNTGLDCNWLLIPVLCSLSLENARVSKGKTRKGQTPLNGEVVRRLNALYPNLEFISNERHFVSSIWTAWKDVHTSIRTVLSHDNFHWLYNLHRHWWGHEGCVCRTMGFSTDMVYYLLVQNSYHTLVIRKELNNLITKKNAWGRLVVAIK